MAELEALARALVAQNLRSKAVLIERLRPLIDRANSLGHMHARIHEALSAAGIDMTFPVYMTTLKRVRKRSQVAPSSPAVSIDPDVQTVSVSGSQEPKPTPVDSRSQEPKRFESANSQPEPEVNAGDAFAVRNALKEAQAVSRTDYRKFAKRNPSK
ncbi:MAG: hypothetical protein VB124_05045 [Burkholderia sp.]